MAKSKLFELKNIKKVIVYSFLILFSIIMVFPFLWMISSSLMTDPEIFHFPPKFFPSEPQWVNYKNVVESMPFFRFIFNTFKISLISTFGLLLSSVISAYAFARINFPGKKLIFSVLLSTMMLPGVVTMIPVFLIFKEIGWYNSHLPLIVPSFFGGAYGIFLLRQFIKTLPIELEEAAFIDGANRATIIFKLIIPNTKPALATLGVFTFMGSWNNLLGPLIYITDYEKMPLTVGLAALIGQYATKYNLLLAGGLISIFPMMLLFIFAQRYFVQGIVMTGIKG